MSFESSRYFGDIKPTMNSQINWGNPISSELRVCWLLNEGCGQNIYDSALFNDGTFNMNANSWVGMDGGPALFFDGSTGFVNCGTTPNILLINQPVTVMARIYPTSGLSTGSRIVSKETANGTGVRLTILDTGALSLGVSGGTGISRISQANAVSFNSWQDVVMTWTGNANASTARFFVDNLETLYATSTGGVTLTGNGGGILGIGNRGNLDRSYAGYISFIYLWNRILERSEISQMFSDPYDFIYPNTIPVNLNSISTPIVSNKYRPLLGVGM